MGKFRSFNLVTILNKLLKKTKTWLMQIKKKEMLISLQDSI